MKHAVDWLERYRRFWEESFEKLDAVLEDLKAHERTRARTAKRRGERR